MVNKFEKYNNSCNYNMNSIISNVLSQVVGDDKSEHQLTNKEDELVYIPHDMKSHYQCY